MDMENNTAQRSCGWMSGPRDAEATISSAKWWFAISRDVFAKSYRRQRSSFRGPVACHRTPTFCSPLTKS
ncbi:MAG TPA: hypothetical protein VFS18_02795 [Actinomycetota bacterium]|nr:hypothetical protein [Actinomycetota bacterium]